MAKCKACGVELRPGARFCDMCGTKVDKICPNCGEVLRDQAKFCDLCGFKLPLDQLLTRKKVRGMVAAGRLHTVALREDGTVLAAGDDQFGQCQVGDWKDIVYIAAGKYHTLGVREDGTVVAAGDGQFGQCNVEDWTDIVAVAAGDSHTLGLRTDGTVVATGRDSSGKCSLGDWKGIVAVAAGMDHSWACARTAPWWPPGRGCSAPAPWPTGRISSPSPRGTSTPPSLRRDGRMVEADGFAAPGVTGVDRPGRHRPEPLPHRGAEKRRHRHRLGDIQYGQCQVEDWTEISAVAAGERHTVALKADGVVLATGDNSEGQCDVAAGNSGRTSDLLL